MLIHVHHCRNDQLFNFWNPDSTNRHNQYIKPIKNSLKEEVMNPSIGQHALSETAFNDLCKKADQILTEQSEAKLLIAKSRPYYNVCKLYLVVLPGDPCNSTKDNSR